MGRPIQKVVSMSANIVRMFKWHVPLPRPKRPASLQFDISSSTTGWTHSFAWIPSRRSSQFGVESHT